MKTVPPLALLAGLLVGWAAATPAMELVVFESERSLVIESYSEEGELALLELPGGGRMGVPKRLIRDRFLGYVPPLEGDAPESGLAEGVPYRDLIARYCQRFQMDCKLVAALIKVESNFNPTAVSPKGAQGLMQLMPQTQKEMGVEDPFDPEQNIRGGVEYLKKLLDILQGDLELTLAAYNAGIGRVQALKAIPPFPETRDYVARILALYPTL